MYRPEIDSYMMGIAMLVSTRATCCRRKVGCVLTNRLNHILATGYNGVPRGMAHCTVDEPCEGAKLQSGSGLDVCQATHAEMNALLQCRNVEEIDTIYTTTSPCTICLRQLMNTGARRIVFLEPYGDTGPAQDKWEQSGRVWHRLPPMLITQMEGMFRDISERSESAHFLPRCY